MRHNIYIPKSLKYLLVVLVWYCMRQILLEDTGRRYVDNEMVALELEQTETDRLASQLETQLRAVMKLGTHFIVLIYCGAK